MYDLCHKQRPLSLATSRTYNLIKDEVHDCNLLSVLCCVAMLLAPEAGFSPDNVLCRIVLLLQELLLALSRRAAWCYARAGRLRSSALIYADVAVLALQRGQLEHAARWGGHSAGEDEACRECLG